MQAQLLPFQHYIAALNDFFQKKKIMRMHIHELAGYSGVLENGEGGTAYIIIIAIKDFTFILEQLASRSRFDITSTK